MEEIKMIRISVRNLVEFILRSGDIDQRRGGMADRDAMQAGSRIHRKIQSRMGGSYQAEVPLSVQIPGDGYVLTVEGRADGIFSDEGQTDKGAIHWITGPEIKNGCVPDRGENTGRPGYAYECAGEEPDMSAGTGEKSAPRMFIDEIKGVYRDVTRMEVPVPVHLAQAKCYAYMYAFCRKIPAIGVQMTYCSLETEIIRRFRGWYSLEELTDWFLEVTRKYQKWAKMQLDWEQVRQASIRPLAFPFPWRDGQKDVAVSVYRTILRKKKLFLQAPTGTGKTLATLYPAVKAMGEGFSERIFYATAKTVTRMVAEETFALLRRNGLRMKTITLTAKEKLCFTGEARCNPVDCPYAEGHFDRVNDAIFELVSSGEALTREALEAQAQKWTVCPFELGLDAAVWADAVICDYNYIFDPRARLKRFFGEGARGEYIFLIDEAHNLADRAREMFSASLYKEDILVLKKEIMPYSRKIARALDHCNRWFLEKKRECESVKVWKDVGTFPVYLMNLCGVMEEYLEDSRNTQRDQKVLDLYFQVRSFLDTCDRLNENYIIYTELCGDGRFLLRLFCVDVSENLQECLNRGRSTVYFSATFLPIRYYKSLLSTDREDYAICAKSVFDPAKRLVLIGTDTSSRYRNRTPGTYRRLAEYVLEVIRAKRGNYMVFFSSYQMMGRTEEQFCELMRQQREQILCICQEPGMSEPERKAFLSMFATVHEEGLAGFCVMGGVFGEGIDLREDRLIGAIVVGAGLPQVCTERELLKGFYDRRGEDGFFYAYLCPGMNKVLQSAGRVIRTEKDEGVILLLDERFDTARCRSMFPAEWEQPGCCTVVTVRKKVEQFWKGKTDKQTDTQTV